MPHYQSAQNVGSTDNFVGHDADARLQPVVVAAQLVERGNGAIAWTISIMDCGPVNRLAVFPNGELLGDAERLTVTDDQTHYVVVRRHPARHERVHAHARQADLALGAVRVLKGEGG